MKKLITLLVLIAFGIPSPIYANRLWMSDEELQSVASRMEWDTTTGSPTINTTTKRSGVASLRCNPTATTAFVQHQYLAANPTVNTFVRFYLYITTATDALDTIFRLRDSGAGFNAVAVKMNSNRTLELWDDDPDFGGQLGSDSSALNTGQWYRIEVSVVGSTATAYIDGSQFATGININNSDSNIAYFGCITATTADLYFDDIAINDSSGSIQTSLPGAGSIVHMYPDSAGDNDGATSTPNSYLNIDEKPTPDDDTTVAWMDAANDILDVNLESSSSAGIDSFDTITLVAANIREKAASAASANWARRIKSQASGTVFGEAVQTHNDQTWTTNGDAAPRLPLVSYTDPQGGGAWTTGLLDTAQVGASTTDATPDIGITSMWLTVEYVDGVAPGGATVSNPMCLINDGLFILNGQMIIK